MSTIIPLQAIPNQKFNINLDGSFFTLTFKETRGVMSVTIVINGITKISNVRCLDGALLIPYDYLEAGNFLFRTQNQEYPFYPSFGSTQFLSYHTQEELDLLREEFPNA